MHGLGAYKGLRQTNSLNAWEYWYSKGIKIFEIDIAKTMDNKYVAVAHALDNKSLRRLELFNLPEYRSFEWFMSQKLFQISTSGLSPLSIEQIVSFIEIHSDIVIMLDLFGLFERLEAKVFTEYLYLLIKDKTIIWKRILLEAYNIEMVNGIKDANDEAEVIYCARYEKTSTLEKTFSPQELIQMGIRFVSYPWHYRNRYPNEIKEFTKAGMTVFSRTKFNTKDSKLRAEGVNVNIIANKFDRFLILFQLPMYMMTYIKRLFVKILIKLKYS